MTIYRKESSTVAKMPFPMSPISILSVLNFIVNSSNKTKTPAGSLGTPISIPNLATTSSSSHRTPSSRRTPHISSATPGLPSSSVVVGKLHIPLICLWFILNIPLCRCSTYNQLMFSVANLSPISNCGRSWASKRRDWHGKYWLEKTRTCSFSGTLTTYPHSAQYKN